jgi:hypothetical protein
MKKLIFLVIAGLILSLPTYTHAQKVVLKSGSLAWINTLEELRVEYIYDDMMVGKMKETDYVAKKVKEYNAKEPGKGDKWQEDWENDRVERFQPKFHGAFNTLCLFAGVNFKIDPDAGGTHKMVVHTTFTEPGYNIYMSSKNASINAEVTFYDETGAEMAKVMITNSPGSGIFEFDYDTGSRIQDAYANAGRSLGALVLDKAWGR